MLKITLALILLSASSLIVAFQDISDQLIEEHEVGAEATSIAVFSPDLLLADAVVNLNAEVKSSFVLSPEQTIEGYTPRQVVFVQTTELNETGDPKLNAGTMQFNEIADFIPTEAGFTFNGQVVEVSASQAISLAIDQQMHYMAIAQGLLPEGTSLEQYLANPPALVKVWGSGGYFEVNGRAPAILRFRGIADSVPGAIETQWGFYQRSRGANGELVLDMYFLEETYERDDYIFSQEDNMRSDNWQYSQVLAIGIGSLSSSAPFTENRDMFARYYPNGNSSTYVSNPDSLLEVYDPNTQIFLDHGYQHFKYDPNLAYGINASQPLNFSPNSL